MRSSLPVLVLALFASLMAAACQAAIIRAPGVLDPDEPPPTIEDPAAFFAMNVEPILEEQCASCHTDATASAGTVFLDPAGDYYASLFAYRDGAIITPGDGAGSILVRKVTIDAHRGGTVSENDASTLRDWIDAEGGDTPPPPPPPDDPVVTGFYPVEDGETRIPLAEVGLPGCELIFTSMRINAGVNLFMTNIELAAATGGLSVAHPRFVIRDDTAGTEVEDRDVFDTVTLRVDEGMRGTLAGTHVIAPFPTNGSLAVQFESAEIPDTM